MTRVLVVEDEGPVRHLLRIALESVGYNVIEAGNGLDGLAICHRTDIGLVITDLEMPVMDGMTMISNLRGEYAQVPVIVTSGSGQEKLDSIRACGVQYIFQKPFCLKELIDAVHTLTSGVTAGVLER
jgi:two-component system chemotaxis response regulator CheY